MFEIIILKNGVEIGRHPLSVPVSTIGRAEGNQIVLPEDSVSRRHARFLVENGKIFVEDLRSGNGTFIRNQRMEGRIELRDGDEVQITPFGLRVRSLLPPPTMTNIPVQPDSAARTVMIPMGGDATPLQVIDPLASGARLILRRGDANKSSYPMSTQPLTLGRSEDRDVILTDPASSRRHATISFNGTSFHIRDEGSANGISMNGNVCRESPLHPGDRLVIGETEFEFVWPGAPPRPAGYAMPGALPGNAAAGHLDPYGETGIMPAYGAWPGSPSAPGVPGMGTDNLGYGGGGYTELGPPPAPRRNPLRLVAMALLVVLVAAIGIKVIADKSSASQQEVVLANADPCALVGDVCPDLDPTCMRCLNIRARKKRGTDLFRQKDYEQAIQEFSRVLNEYDPGDAEALHMRNFSYEFWVLSQLDERLRDRVQTSSQKLTKMKEDLGRAKEAFDRYGKAKYTKDTPEAELVRARNGLSEAISLSRDILKVNSEEAEAVAMRQEAETILKQSQYLANRLGSIRQQSAQDAFETSVRETFEAGNQAQTSGNLARATQKYKEVLSLDPDRKTQYPALAERELGALQKVLKDRAKPLVGEATSRMKNGQWIEAREKLEAALKIDSTLDEARTKLQEVNEECESRAKKLYSEAKVQFNVNQYSQAEKLLNQALAYVPDKSNETHQRAVTLLKQMGKE